MKVTLFTIYSPYFKGYYNERGGCLDSTLSIHTKLFKNKADAMRRIEGLHTDLFDKPYNRLCTDLAWKYLESKYSMDRWHLDVKYNELEAAEDLFKDLEVRRVTLDAEV